MTHGNQAQEAYAPTAVKVGPVTADHLISKDLFPNLSLRTCGRSKFCMRCHGGFFEDDDYFRLLLTLTEKSKAPRTRRCPGQ